MPGTKNPQCLAALAAGAARVASDNGLTSRRAALIVYRTLRECGHDAETASRARGATCAACIVHPSANAVERAVRRAFLPTHAGDVASGRGQGGQSAAGRSDGIATLDGDDRLSRPKAMCERAHKVRTVHAAFHHR